MFEIGVMCDALRISRLRYHHWLPVLPIHLLSSSCCITPYHTLRNINLRFPRLDKHGNTATTNAAVRPFFKKKGSEFHLPHNATTSGTHVPPVFDE
jgi:hypothetical protein